MLRLDKTGPMGQGSETGRKRGKCSSEDTPSMERTPRGRGNRCELKNRMTDYNENTAVLGRGRNKRRGRGFGMEKGCNSQMN